jgi:hypothetical protein
LTATLDHIHWIADSLNSAIRAAPSTLSIVTHIHATSTSSETSAEVSTLEQNSSPCTPVDEKHSVSSESPNSLTPPMQIYCGRPNIQKIFDEEIEIAVGPVSVDGR